MASKVSLDEVFVQFVANEQINRERAFRLRPRCEGKIDDDCLDWLVSEASAEVWRVAIGILEPYIRRLESRRKGGKGGA